MSSRAPLAKKWFARDISEDEVLVRSDKNGFPTARCVKRPTMEKLTQGDHGRENTGFTNDVFRGAVPDEAPRSPSEMSQIVQKVPNSSVAGNKNVSEHSGRRRSESSSIPLPVPEGRVTVPEQLTSLPNHIRMPLRSGEAAEPVTVSRGGRSSTETSTAAETKEVTAAPTTAYRAISGSGRHHKHGRPHADLYRRESTASVTERFGYQILPATREQSLRNTGRDRGSSELPRETPSHLETSVSSEACIRELQVPERVTESRTKPIIKASRSRQLQPSQTSPCLSQTRSSLVDHPPIRAPGKRAAAFTTRSSFSTVTA
ncbi:uncharacterized protein [Dermacentor albipictus]|uniref:uncharacterized protein n=1 Tax=Dermacentor albipictus TaxID=60249 RepID=UPI0031FBD905